MLTKEEAVREMVASHYQFDPRIREIIRFLSPHEEDPTEPIKVLDVTPDTPLSGRVMAFTFGPYENFPYKMQTADITPEEMEQVRRQEIPLPSGWSLQNSVIYPASDYKSQGGRRWRRSKEIVRLSLAAGTNRHRFTKGSQKSVSGGLR